ncbi:MAG TPA: ATP-binding protein [Nitrolancea sp.]|nr:ATP-binding protein [Nitrolancea sp.]
MEYVSLDAPTGSRHERLLGLPLFYKVLVGNSIIVVAGAIIGTAATLKVSAETSTAFDLVAIFAIIGTFASILVNWIVLRAALRPLSVLEEAVDDVRHGNFGVRAEKVAFSDPSMDALIDTFNGMLDAVERYRIQLGDLSMQVLSAQEEERKRISRELHDNTAQTLTAQLLRLKTIEARGGTLDPAGLTRLIETTAQALEEVRYMAHELRPPSLDDLGLRASLEGLAAQYDERFSLPVQVRGDRLRRLGPDAELAIYRIVQEALTNVAKHAGASGARVELVCDQATLRVRISDDGRGFDEREVALREGAGLGLFGMQERAALVGGTLAISSRSGGGTVVALAIPLGGARAHPDSRLEVLA